MQDYRWRLTDDERQEAKTVITAAISDLEQKL